MKTMFTLIFSLIAVNAFAFNGPNYNTYHNPNATSNTYIQPQNTIIHHQNGTNTYIQQHVNSGTIRYSDGSVDYYQSR